MQLYLKNYFDKGYNCLSQRKLFYLFDNRYKKKRKKKKRSIMIRNNGPLEKNKKLCVKYKLQNGVKLFKTDTWHIPNKTLINKKNIKYTYM